MRRIQEQFSTAALVLATLVFVCLSAGTSSASAHQTDAGKVVAQPQPQMEQSVLPLTF